jgi:serine/threonine-protein kinase
LGDEERRFNQRVGINPTVVSTLANSARASSAAPSPVALGTLLVSGATTAGLAVYQWLELMIVRGGGTVGCSVNETVNCATVWNSEFASRVHSVLGMPVAGLGVVWGAAAVALAAMLWRRRLTEDWLIHAAAVKVWAAFGLVSIVVFAGASLSVRAVCLTCLGTYGLVAAYAVSAVVLLPPPRWPPTNAWLGALAWVFVVSAPVFLVALIPGASTPKAGEVVRLEGKTRDELIATLGNMPEREKMLTAAARLKWQSAPMKDVSDFKVRVRHGPESAPIRVVEFSDVLCPHCASFEHSMEELRRAAPDGSLSIEPRLFPLVDDGCEKPGDPGTPKEVRCVGAKAQICSESHPLYWEVRKALFAQQQTLRSADAVLSTVTGVTGVSKEALMRCVASSETQSKLKDDIEYAKRYDIEGTPLVLLNGRATWPSSGFILGMAVGQGDVNAPWFTSLPSPPPMNGH